MININISSIICEYNPLHNGHKYQIDLTRNLTKCEGLIAIMSGNFVQRGEPAIIDKWRRAEMALKNGVDLVIELPSAFALSSAEFFAHGAVSILNDLKIVNSICFGSEAGQIEPLMAIAEILTEEPHEYRMLLKDYLDQGLTFPLSRSKALLSYIAVNSPNNIVKFKELLETSNNILGIEYCKSLIRNKSHIQPFTIKRLGGSYNSSEVSQIFSSATAVRKLMKQMDSLDLIKSQLPVSSFNIIMQLIDENYDFAHSDNIFDYIKYKAITDRHESLKNIPETGEGLHKRIYKYLYTSESLEQLIKAVKTKRYTYTKLCRILTQYFIGFENFPLQKLYSSRCNYVRVLGLNTTGAEILKDIKTKSDMNIITKFPQKPDNVFLQLDLASTKAYSIINKNIRFNEDFLRSPITEFSK